MACSSMLLAVLCTLSTLYAASGQSGVESEGCLFHDKTYSYGQKFTISGECNTYTCEKNGAVSALTCPVMRLEDGSPCHLSGMDLTKEYPMCCPQIVCPRGPNP